MRTMKRRWISRERVTTKQREPGPDNFNWIPIEIIVCLVSPFPHLQSIKRPRTAIIKSTLPELISTISDYRFIGYQLYRRRTCVSVCVFRLLCDP